MMQQVAEKSTFYHEFGVMGFGHDAPVFTGGQMAAIADDMHPTSCTRAKRGDPSTEEHPLLDPSASGRTIQLA